MTTTEPMLPHTLEWEADGPTEDGITFTIRCSECRATRVNLTADEANEWGDAHECAKAVQGIDPEEFGIETDRGASTLVRRIAVKAQIKTLTDELKVIDKALRMELMGNPEPIVDGEHGIVAVLMERRKPAEFDLISMAGSSEAGLLIQAAAQGLLTTRTEQLRGMRGKSPAADALLNRYEMPAGMKYELVVEETK